MAMFTLAMSFGMRSAQPKLKITWSSQILLMAVIATLAIEESSKVTPLLSRMHSLRQSTELKRSSSRLEILTEATSTQALTAMKAQSGTTLPTLKRLTLAVMTMTSKTEPSSFHSTSSWMNSVVQASATTQSHGARLPSSRPTIEQTVPVGTPRSQTALVMSWSSPQTGPSKSSCRPILGLIACTLMTASHPMSTTD